MALTKTPIELSSTPSIVDGGNATAITIDSSENVGIGCTPSYPLEVAGAAGDSLTITARSGDATAANNAGGGFRNIGSATATSRRAQMWLDADGANLGGGDYFYIEKQGNSGDVILDQFSNADMIFQVNAGAERMRIDSSGNVGIGVSNPSDYYAKDLVVTGPAEGGITIASTGNHTNYLLFADSTSGVARYAGMIGYAHDTDLMSFRTNSIERMSIAATGDLATTSSTTGLAASFLNTNTSGYGMRVTTYSSGVEYGLAVDSYGGGYSRDFTVGVDGNVNVLTGNLVIGTAGKGIDFSATTGSGTSELLDDYEEGTWTPTVAGCSINVSRAYYTKIGNLVTANFNFTVTATDGSSNPFGISGKPFVGSIANAESNGSLMIRYATIDANTINLSLYTYSKSATIEIYQSKSNTANWVPLRRNQVQASPGTAMIASITYETDT